MIANAAPVGPKEEFDVAIGYYKDKQFDNAEKGFAALVQKNPKARIAPDAIYYLGETYSQRGRPREAAEQFLKISTDYSTSGRAPEAMLRLGQSLNALGAKEQACATFGEIGRKYPNAASVKSGAERGKQAPAMSGDLKQRGADFCPLDHTTLFAPLAGAKRLLLAVSGGPDSMALMQLAAHWGGAPPLSVATVDHGFRAAAAQEARHVAAAAARVDLPHATLVWAGPKPDTRVQERARTARYRLLLEHALAIGADHVVTAHHADDQAETILFRLARGSGIAGLAGMRATRPLGPLTLVRPLLGLTKAELAAVCTTANLDAVHDPSNDNPAFARVRLRGLAPTLAALGLDRDAVLRLGRRLARADDALQHAAETALRDLPALRTTDTFTVDACSFAALPDEIRLRVLEREIARVGDTTRIRLERLERLAAGLVAADGTSRPFSATLAGALVRHDGRTRLIVRRAPERRRSVRP